MVEYAKGFLNSDMQIVVICEMFGWTYDQYFNQPVEFIEMIRGKIKVDSQKVENENKKKR